MKVSDTFVNVAALRPQNKRYVHAVERTLYMRVIRIYIWQNISHHFTYGVRFPRKQNTIMHITM